MIVDYYTGIGSRETPPKVLKYMTYLGEQLADKMILRSGKAGGADEAFQLGVEKKQKQKGFEYVSAQIFTPWRNFKNPNLSDQWDLSLDFVEEIAGKKGIEIQTHWLKEIHPAFDNLSQGAMKLHLRNMNQIVGLQATSPCLSRFVVYYATEKNGHVKGGTATAVNLARKFEIPTFNLLFEEDKINLVKFLREEGIANVSPVTRRG